ncbi:MAG: DJ-1/PfpI family protein [Verrucomicrobiota bacterium]
MAKKILIVTDDGGESYEILYARHRFLEAGYQPFIAATKRKLLNGRLTCYENVRLEVAQCGATWINKQSVVDGKIITAQTWESHPEFYRDIFKHLNQ